MTGAKMALGIMIFASFVAGAFVVGYAMMKASHQEKPRLLSIGISVLIAGTLLGYIAVDIFLALEGRGH